MVGNDKVLFEFVDQCDSGYRLVVKKDICLGGGEAITFGVSFGGGPITVDIPMREVADLYAALGDALKASNFRKPVKPGFLRARGALIVSEFDDGRYSYAMLGNSDFSDHQNTTYAHDYLEEDGRRSIHYVEFDVPLPVRSEIKGEVVS